MQRLHQGLALIVSIFWGLNLIVMKVGITDVSPLLFSALRFSLIAIPAVFFFKKPKISWKKLTIFGLVLGFFKLTFLLVGLSLGVKAGIAALILQTQVLFTMLIAVFYSRYSPSKNEILGTAIAFLGIVLLGLSENQSINVFGFLIVLFSALSWGVANNITNTFPKSEPMINVVVWMGLIPPLPILAYAYLSEGPVVFLSFIHNFGQSEFLSILYVVLIGSFFALTSWSWLMRQYNPAKTAIYGITIPVFALFFDWLILGETLNLHDLLASSVIIIGLLVHQKDMFKSKHLEIAEEKKLMAVNSR